MSQFCNAATKAGLSQGKVARLFVGQRFYEQAAERQIPSFEKNMQV